MGGVYEDLCLGLVLCGGGLFLLLKWAYFVDGAVKWGNAVWNGLGIPQASERSRRTVGRIIAQIIGAVWILGGLAQLFTFFTGRDWPLHYANWRDLWPF
jgi:hypothetical protein